MPHAPHSAMHWHPGAAKTLTAHNHKEGRKVPGGLTCVKK